MTAPAVVSGPGALSQRTDAPGQPIRSLPNPKYGEAQEFEQQQKSAPLAEAAAMPAGPAPSEMARQAGQQAPAPLPGLFDPGDPNVPMTSGAPIGPGPNTVTGGGFQPAPMSLSQQMAQYAVGDGADAIAWLANNLAQMGQ